MFLRSALSFVLLVLGASCVPPVARDGGAMGISAASDLSYPNRRGARHIVVPPPEILAAAIAPGHPAAPFNAGEQSEEAMRNSLRCLTDAVYYEARSEPEDGQRAVAQVVLNRVRHPAFPSNVCGVVYQGSQRRTGCQFSFTCDGSRNRRIEPGAWAHARQIAEEALAGRVYAPVGVATHFHTTAIRPWWAASLARAVTVGSHIFYRWRGEWGNPKAFRQPYSGDEWGHAYADSAADGSMATGVQTSAFGVRIHREGGSIDGPINSSAALVKIHRSSVPTGAAGPHGVRVRIGVPADAEEAAVQTEIAGEPDETVPVS